MTDFPTLSYASTSSEIPTLSFVYLKPEKVLLSGCTFPCYAIIGNTLPPPPGDMGRCREPVLGSLSNSVFERRTSTGSGLFASLGSGSVENLG